MKLFTRHQWQTTKQWTVTKSTDNIIVSIYDISHYTEVMLLEVITLTKIIVTNQTISSNITLQSLCQFVFGGVRNIYKIIFLVIMYSVIKLHKAQIMFKKGCNKTVSSTH